MDYDADGILDFISGCYDPGDLYLFRGLGDGRYAAVEKLYDRDDVALVHHPEELAKYERINGTDAGEDEIIGARVASFGSWPTPVDWDDDGDLDIVIGGFAGRVYLRENVGTRKKPVYASASVAVEAAGEELSVGGHANPVAADWNGDGRFDLVVGAHDGSVSWYENIGAAKAPAFGERQVLVEAKSSMKFLTQYLEPGEAPKPGVRAQICVTDYNGDGRLDLLVGDYSSYEDARALDEDQRARLDGLLVEERELVAKLWTLERDTPEATEVQDRLAALSKERGGFLADDRNQRTSSFVWLFLREPAKVSQE